MPEDGTALGGQSEQMLTLGDVARLLKVHPNSVRRWAKRGLITVYRIGTRGDMRFRTEDVTKFLQLWDSRRTGKDES